jgi:hypothetical protein
LLFILLWIFLLILKSPGIVILNNSLRVFSDWGQLFLNLRWMFKVFNLFLLFKLIYWLLFSLFPHLIFFFREVNLLLCLVFLIEAIINGIIHWLEELLVHLKGINLLVREL